MGTKEMSATIGVDTFAILGFSIFQGEQLSEFWGSGSYGEQTVPHPPTPPAPPPRRRLCTETGFQGLCRFPQVKSHVERKAYKTITKWFGSFTKVWEFL